MVVVYSPLGSRSSLVSRLAPRRKLGRGAGIAIISNGKPNATPLLKTLSGRLRDRHGLVELYFFDKRIEANGAGIGAPEAWLAAVAASAKAAISGCGD